MENIWNEKILDDIQERVYIINADTFQLVEANKKIKKRFPQYQKGVPCYRLFHEAEKPCPDCGIAEAIRTKQEVKIIKERKEDKQHIQITFNQYQYKPDQKEKLCICIATDVTNVIKSSTMLKNVLNGMRAATYAVNPETYQITFVNSYLRSVLPNAKQDTICYQSLMGRDAPCEQCPISQLTHDGQTIHREVYIQKLKKYLNIDSVRITNADGQTMIVFTGYDVTKHVQNQQQLHYMAFFDHTFHVKNQVAFIKDVETRMEHQKPYLVSVARLKKLQQYNLVFGRKAGDRLLKELIAYYFSVYPSEKVYRISGTKFAFISDTEEEQKQISVLTEHPFSKEMEHNHKGFRPYVDFVQMEVLQFAQKTEEVMHNIEYALSKIKAEDKNHVLHFTEKESLEIYRKNHIMKMLNKDHDNLADKGFQVYYQPIYDVQKKCFSKCEALLRFYDATLGWVSPLEFIPIAEENGNISKLGKFVLEQACMVLAKREREHLPPIQININVSTIEFADENFYDGIVDTITKYQINPKYLHFEITESIMMNTFTYVVDIMKKIIALGIGFSIDDFGTGYASFGYVAALPLQAIKLDKTFIDKIVQSDMHYLIVDNLVKFAKELKLKIVTEGVERKEQYDMLIALGCDYIQGYMFSKPLPEQELFAFLTQEVKQDV